MNKKENEIKIFTAKGELILKSLTMMIKPASSNCNMHCEYCFYRSLSSNREYTTYGYMHPDLLEIIVKKALSEAEEICTFAFQGGEPTLVGLEFFQKLIQYEKKYNQNKIKISHAIQTNGLKIDQEWAHFLAKNQFLVGISLDGPKSIHDLYRKDSQGKGTYQRVIQAIEFLKQYQADYNILSVVTSQVARHAHQIYRFFQKRDFQYIQFIPCLDPLGENPGKYPYSLIPERYSHFLKTLFDLWYYDMINHKIVSIRYFDNLLQLMLGYPPEACGMLGHCTCQFIIEANGGVYPCDFYAIDQWYIGNIKEKSFSQLLASPTAQQFVQLSTYIDSTCRSCSWFALCRGGCRRWREPFIDGKPRLNYLCPAYREFFGYTFDRFQKIVEKIKAGEFK